MAELEFRESPNSKCTDLGKQGFGEIRKRPEAEFGPIGNCGVGFQPWRGIITWRGFASLGPARPNSAPFSIFPPLSILPLVISFALGLCRTAFWPHAELDDASSPSEKQETHLGPALRRFGWIARCRASLQDAATSKSASVTTVHHGMSLFIKAPPRANVYVSGLRVLQDSILAARSFVWCIIRYLRCIQCAFHDAVFGGSKRCSSRIFARLLEGYGFQSFGEHISSTIGAIHDQMTYATM